MTKQFIDLNEPEGFQILRNIMEKYVGRLASDVVKAEIQGELDRFVDSTILKYQDDLIESLEIDIINNEVFVKPIKTIKNVQFVLSCPKSEFGDINEQL